MTSTKLWGSGGLDPRVSPFSAKQGTTPIKPPLLLTQPLIPSARAALDAAFEVHTLYDAADREDLLVRIAPSIRAIAAGHAPAEFIARFPRLEIIAGPGVGYDGIDIAAAKQRGIRVTNTPDVLNDAVAELTIALMLALARQVPQADAFVRAGHWPNATFAPSVELTGRTVGILGLGRIGKEIARRAQAMKMRVVYHGRHAQPREPYTFYADLTEMAREADWLVVIAPGGAGTEAIVSRAVLAALGPQGRLVNMARGSLVDEAALIEMLGTGALGGAALDVFADEPRVPEALFGLPNVVLSPHQGSHTTETREAMGALLVANLKAHFAGAPLLTPVA